MPHTLTKTAYTFAELSDPAKEQARNWWREQESYDFDTDCVIEDAQRMAELLGIEFDTRAVNLMNGSTRRDPCVFWSGFSSQGDGACFEGSYAYAKGAVKAVTNETGGNDKTLIRIAQDLQDAQRSAFYKLTATVKHSGHYNHEHSTTIDVEHADDSYRSIGDAGELIAEALRDFMRWIYSQLEAEYTYRMSDENVDESIIINEYDFTDDGHFAS
jgi:hypothetical protein